MKHSTAKIIIAHRGILFRECLRETLVSNDFVIPAVSGESNEIFGFIQKFNPEIVISDCKLRDIDGLTFLRQIKESNSDIKVIAFVNQFVSDLRSFENEADGLLNSNCDLSELLHCINEILNNRKDSIKFSELIDIDFDCAVEFALLTRKEKIILRYLSTFKSATEIADEL